MVPGALVDLQKYITTERIVFLPNGMNKDDALKVLVHKTAEYDTVTDPIAFESAIFEREEVSSTGIGNGIAVPHTKLPSINGFTLTIGISEEGIPFAANDGQDVHVFVMIAATNQERQHYLKILASVAATLKYEGVFTSLIQSNSAEDVVALLTTA